MKIFKEYSDELRALGDLIRAQAKPGETLTVLEAGCGREWYFDLDGIEKEIVGVDMDEAALKHRVDVQRDLDRYVVGDLNTVDLPDNAFDVIYSSFVLEHVEGAEAVLDNFVRWAKPGGLIIVRVPDVDGVQTFLAKRVPRWSIILYYKYAWGIKNAGQPGYAPYPAHYEDVIRRPSFKKYCDERQLKLADEFGVGSYAKRGRGILSKAMPIVARGVSLATAGAAHDRYVDLTYVVYKPDGTTASGAQADSPPQSAAGDATAEIKTAPTA